MHKHKNTCANTCAHIRRLQPATRHQSWTHQNWSTTMSYKAQKKGASCLYNTRIVHLVYLTFITSFWLSFVSFREKRRRRVKNGTCLRSAAAPPGNVAEKQFQTQKWRYFYGIVLPLCMNVCVCVVFNVLPRIPEVLWLLGCVANGVDNHFNVKGARIDWISALECNVHSGSDQYK